MCACFPFPFPFLPNLDCCLIVENISYLAWWWLLNLCKEFAMTFVYLFSGISLNMEQVLLETIDVVYLQLTSSFSIHVSDLLVGQQV